MRQREKKKSLTDPIKCPGVQAVKDSGHCISNEEKGKREKNYHQNTLVFFFLPKIMLITFCTYFWA